MREMRPRADKETKVKEFRLQVRNRFKELEEEEDAEEDQTEDVVAKIKKLGFVGVVEPEEVNQVRAKGCWEELELAVDSGAGESVGEERLKRRYRWFKETRTRRE